MTDFAIIGGGAIGLLTALELARAGAQVSLLERAATGQESSWAGGGIVSPLYPWRYPDAVTALATWSQQHFPDFAETLRDSTGIDPEFTVSGLLFLETDEQAQAKSWATTHQHRLEQLNPDALQPGLNSPSTDALWMPHIGQIRNPRLMKALKIAAQQAGVQIHEHTTVARFDIQQAKIQGFWSEQGDYWRIPQVIVCAGAWSAQLLATVGIALPIRPILGQMLLLQTPPGLVSRIILHQNRYLIPRRDGHLLVGSTLENVGFDKRTTDEARSSLWQTACALVPGLAACPIVQQWAGLRPGTPDGIPYIGPHPQIAGLYLNSGHFRNGIVLSLASTRLLADLVLQRPPVLEPRPYALDAVRTPTYGAMGEAFPN